MALVEQQSGAWIVAEVSKNWVEGRSDTVFLLSQMFEHIIAVNFERGYGLHSFQLHRMLTGPDILNETIIAVFKRL